MNSSNFHLSDQDIDIGYLGKSGLPSIQAQRRYTKDQLIEIRKCRDDIEYFAEKYFTVVTMDEGKKLIPLFDYQRELLTKFQDNRFNIVTQARQSGKCVSLNTTVNIRNKNTGQVEKITVGELYEQLAKKRDSVHDE